MKLSQRVIMLFSIGFGIGVIVGVMICAVSGTLSHADGTLHLCPDAWIAVVGDPLIAFIIEALVCGLMGGFATGASAVYGIEEWGLMKCTVSHYVAVMAVYLIVGLSLRWFTPADYVEVGITMFVMTIVYAFIWLSNYLSYKAELKKINRELDELKALEIKGMARA